MSRNFRADDSRGGFDQNESRRRQFDAVSSPELNDGTVP